MVKRKHTMWILILAIILFGAVAGVFTIVSVDDGFTLLADSTIGLTGKTSPIIYEQIFWFRDSDHSDSYLCIDAREMCNVWCYQDPITFEQVNNIYDDTFGSYGSACNYCCSNGIYDRQPTYYIDSKYWDIYTYRTQSYGGIDTKMSVHISQGYNSENNDASSWIVSKDDFSSRLFRTNIVFTAQDQRTACTCGGSGTLIASIGGVEVPIKYLRTSSCNTQPVSVTGLFETRPAILSNQIDIFFQGIKINTITPINNDKLKFYIDGSVECSSLQASFTNPRYQYLYSCQQDTNDVLVVNKYSPGETVSLETLSFTPKSFCLAHPAILKDLGKGGSTTTAEIYQILVAGDSYTLESDQEMWLFYIYDGDGDASIVSCDEGYAWDSVSSSCILISEIGIPPERATFDNEDFALDYRILEPDIDWDESDYVKYQPYPVIKSGDWVQDTRDFSKDIDETIDYSDYFKIEHAIVDIQDDEATYRDYVYIDENSLAIRFKPDGIFTTMSTIDNSGETFLGESKVLKVDVNNLIVDGAEIGVNLKSSNGLFFTGDTIYTKTMNMNLGWNTLSFDVPVNEIGEYTVTVQPFIIFDRINLVSDNSASTMYIVNEPVIIPDICTLNVDSCYRDGMNYYNGYFVVEDCQCKWVPTEPIPVECNLTSVEDCYTDNLDYYNGYFTIDDCDCVWVPEHEPTSPTLPIMVIGLVIIVLVLLGLVFRKRPKRRKRR